MKIVTQLFSLLFHSLARRLPNLSEDVRGFLQFLQENDRMLP